METKTPAPAKKRGSIEATAEAPAPAFHWDQSRTPHFTFGKLEKFFHYSLGTYAAYLAVYMFTGKGSRDEDAPIGRSCHGYMHSTPITHGWVSALRYTNQKNLNDETLDEASRWYIEKFLLGKFSPWATLLPYLTIVYNRNKVPVAYIVDGDENKKAIDKHLLQNFNIASRWPREFPSKVQGMFDLWLSGNFKKTEALLLQDLIRFSPATGVYTLTGNTNVGGGGHFYQGPHVYRILECKPNSGMVFEKGRFTAVTGAISSNNDAYVWGHDARNHTKLTNLFNEIASGKISKTTITRFGGVLKNIEEGSVKDFVKRFRDLYEEECKRVPGGDYKDVDNKPQVPVGKDNWRRYA